MTEYKLVTAFPQVLPGNKEMHYGMLCDVRRDGVYVELDEITAANWYNGGRIHGPLRYAPPEVVVEAPKAVEVPFEPVAVEEKPRTMAEVIENGSGKRPGRPAKKVE